MSSSGAPRLFPTLPLEGSVGACWAAEPSSGRVSVDTSGAMPSLSGDSRLYLVESPTAPEWVSQRYAMLGLLGKQLTFSLDVSHVGCSCNAAVYLVREFRRERQLDWRGGAGREKVTDTGRGRDR